MQLIGYNRKFFNCKTIVLHGVKGNMVKVQVGVQTRWGYIDPIKLKCLDCGKEFYHPYADYGGYEEGDTGNPSRVIVIPVCPGCRKPIDEYVSY